MKAPEKIYLQVCGDCKDNDCENCSNCLNEGEVADKTLDAKKVISCIARMKRAFGTTMIIDVLRGSKNKKVIDQGFDSLTTYIYISTINFLVKYEFIRSN